MPLGLAVVTGDGQIAVSPLAIVGAIGVLAAEPGQIVHKLRLQDCMTNTDGLMTTNLL